MRKSLERIATETTNFLFENSFCEKADRLVLTTKNGKELGGWCFAAVKREILAALKEARPPVKKRK